MQGGKRFGITQPTLRSEDYHIGHCHCMEVAVIYLADKDRRLHVGIGIPCHISPQAPACGCPLGRSFRHRRVNFHEPPSIGHIPYTRIVTHALNNQRVTECKHTVGHRQPAVIVDRYTVEARQCRLTFGREVEAERQHIAVNGYIMRHFGYAVVLVTVIGTRGNRGDGQQSRPVDA